MIHKQTIGHIVKTVKDEMSKMGYSERTMNSYIKVWEFFKIYAEENNIIFYTTEVGYDFLEQRCQIDPSFHVKKTMKEKIRALNRLDEYYKYQIISTKRPLRKRYSYPNNFTDPINAYVNYKKVEGVSASRIRAISLYLERFSNHMLNLGLREITELVTPHILSFVEFCNNYNTPTVINTFSCLRGFFSFVYKKSYINKDLCNIIPSTRYHKECTVPSAYSKEEVEKVLKSVDRSNTKGQRDILFCPIHIYT